MRREIRVCLDRKPDIGEDLVVVGPCWRGEIELFIPRVEFCKEKASQVNSTSAGNRLEGHNLRRA